MLVLEKKSGKYSSKSNIASDHIYHPGGTKCGFHLMTGRYMGKVLFYIGQLYLEVKF